MSAPKTRPTDASVPEFLAAVSPARRREDAEAVCAMMARVTGCPPVLWGSSIVGFGSYVANAGSKNAMDWPLVGFSPRKANLVLYIIPGFGDFSAITDRLGAFSTGASCLYVKSLADIDLDVLEELVVASVEAMRARYPSKA